MAAKEQPGLEIGAVIVGAHQGGTYTIQSLIGRGANGTVYLVRTASGYPAALKTGPEKPELKAEVEVLAALKQRELESGIRRPYLLDADRYQDGERSIPFYVMKFVKGDAIDAYIRRYGYAAIGEVGSGVLERLQNLHRAGYIFGDLKPCHVLVESSGAVELVDYGGASAIGTGVKQYSGWYDRKYWNGGTRVADPGYDLFAFAVLCLHVFGERALRKLDAETLPQTRTVEDLIRLIGQVPPLQAFSPWLKRALSGNFSSSGEALAYWKAICRAHPNAKRRKASSKLLAAAFFGSLLVLAGVLYAAAAL